MAKKKHSFEYLRKQYVAIIAIIKYDNGNKVIINLLLLLICCLWINNNKIQLGKVLSVLFTIF